LSGTQDTSTALLQGLLPLLLSASVYEDVLLCLLLFWLNWWQAMNACPPPEKIWLVNCFFSWVVLLRLAVPSE
jgi:hypothetical protein